MTKYLKPELQWEMSRYRQIAIPLYTQIASALRSEMNEGAWPAGAKLPAIDELANRFGVAPLTIRQALTTLEGEGLVRCRQGIGTIVQKGRGEQRWLQLPADWHSLVRMVDGLEVRRTLIEASDRTPKLHPEDGLSAESYKFLKRVHYRNEEPFCIIEMFLSSKIYLRAPKRFRNQVVVPILDNMKDVVIKKAMQYVSIDVANAETAGLLAMPLGGPIAKVRRTITDNKGVVIYVADVLYKSNVVHLAMDISPASYDA